jgi:tyrosyl-tRNA synthetase
LMWRYYELLTDLSLAEIDALHEAATSCKRNPRDIKVELAKRIISDFHSKEDAERAEQEFRRIFTLKEMPVDIEERTVTSGTWELKHLLVTLELASSKAEARRLIEQGGVYVDGERCDPKINKYFPLRPDRPGFDIEITAETSRTLQVGKRRFVRVRGE